MSAGELDNNERLREGITRFLDQNAEVIRWVDRLLNMLDDSPETVQFLSERYGPLMWSIDHLREARFAMKEAIS